MRITLVRRSIHALIMGAPGSGKGTISNRMCRDFDMHHLSSGNILRSEILHKSKHGLLAQECIEAGRLVPDGVMTSLVLSQLKNIPTYRSWVLDGFPRTTKQADSLYQADRIDLVIDLEVPFSTIMDRLSGRWIHLPSGRVYNEGFNPPHKPGYDDVTGEPLTQRDDDKPKTIEKRLKTYEDQTRPLLEFYDKKNLLHTFRGTETDSIYPHIVNFLKGVFDTNARRL